MKKNVKLWSRIYDHYREVAPSQHSEDDETEFKVITVDDMSSSEDIPVEISSESEVIIQAGSFALSEDVELISKIVTPPQEDSTLKAFVVNCINLQRESLKDYTMKDYEDKLEKKVDKNGKWEYKVSPNTEDRVKFVTHLATGIHAMGFTVIPVNGKAPEFGGWQKMTHDNCLTKFNPFPKWFTFPNYGIRTGHDVNLWVLDLDNERAVDLIQQTLGTHRTFTIQSGSGIGRHYYYKSSSRIAKYLGQTQKLLIASGIEVDIRFNGGQVVGPGCLHPKSMNYYTIIDDSPVVDMPDALYDLLTTRNTSSPTGTIPIASTTSVSSSPPIEEKKSQHIYTEIPKDEFLVHFNEGIQLLPPGQYSAGKIEMFNYKDQKDHSLRLTLCRKETVHASREDSRLMILHKSMFIPHRGLI